MEEENRRVKYTKMVIKESFLKLLQEKPITKITVSEICKLADVNRGTFYIHYLDIYQLLENIEQELYSELEKVLKSKPVSMTNFINLILKIIYDNSDLCSILLGDYGDSVLMEKIIDVFRIKSLEMWKQYKIKISELQADYVFTFLALGSLGVIKNWIKSGYTDSFKDIAQLIEKISNNGLNAFN